MEGLPDLTVDQAYELTDASAERSAAGAVIALSVEQVARHLRSDAALMTKMIEQGYGHAETLKRRIAAVEAWLAKPALIERDEKALEQAYAAVLEIDLAEITEPILACPNDPDDVKLLSEVAGDKIDEVFIGSCMTNIGHFRAAGRIFDKAGYPATKIWLTPPTKMDEAQLKKEGYYSIFSQVGARTEIPGCSLCMGNQARVAPKATILSTSTRNFDDRMGDGARVYLGSAELAAVAAIKGALPTPAEYFEAMKAKVLPAAGGIVQAAGFRRDEGLLPELRRGSVSAMISLAGHRTLITGGSRGIGRAAAILFAEAGSDVAFNYHAATKRPPSRSRRPSNPAAASASSAKPTCPKRDEAVALAGAVADAWGGVDILVNNHGIWTYLEMGEGDVDSWKETMEVNLDGVFYLTDAVVPLMKARNKGLHHQRRFDRRDQGRSPSFPLRGDQGGAQRPDEILVLGARALRHPGQLRRPGLGGHGHEHGVLRRSGLPGERPPVDSPEAHPAARGYRRSDPFPGLGPGPSHHRGDHQRQRGSRPVRLIDGRPVEISA